MLLNILNNVIQFYLISLITTRWKNSIQNYKTINLLIIKYRGLVSNQTVTYTDRVLCESCAGLTVPDLDLERYIIYINQHTNTKGRVIFTILHELSHIYCHLANAQHQPIYMSLMSKNASEKYPEELILIEKEADTVALNLILNRWTTKESSHCKRILWVYTIWNQHQ